MFVYVNFDGILCIVFVILTTTEHYFGNNTCFKSNAPFGKLFHVSAVSLVWIGFLTNVCCPATGETGRMD